MGKIVRTVLDATLVEMGAEVSPSARLALKLRKKGNDPARDQHNPRVSLTRNEDRTTRRGQVVPRSNVMIRDRMRIFLQRPVHRAYQGDESLVRRWVEQDCPATQVQAKARGATIYFADEVSVRSDYPSGTSWAPLAETPVIGATGSRYSVNLVSAISPCGELRWMWVEGRMNATRSIDFLSALIERKPVFVTMDNHPSHRAKAVADFVEANILTRAFSGRLSRDSVSACSIRVPI